MSYVPYEAAVPSVAISSPNEPVVIWDRSPEEAIVEEYFSSVEGTKFLAISNIGQDLFSRFIHGVARKSGKNFYWLSNRGMFSYGIHLAIFGSFTTNMKSVLPNTALEVLKYTSGANIYFFAESYILRTLSNYIHNQRRAGAPVTLRAALYRFGYKLDYEFDGADKLLDSKWQSSKISVDAIKDLLAKDIESSENFPKFLNASVFGFANQAVGYQGERFFIRVGSIGLASVAILNTYSSGSFHNSAYSRNIKNVMELDFGCLTFDEAINLVREAFPAEVIDDDFLKNSFGALGVQVRQDNNVSRVYVETDISKVIRSVSDRISANLKDANIEPKIAPIDAHVEGDVLRLGDKGMPETGAPEDVIEALREEHLEDVSRLRKSLSGSNAGSGFLSRLEAAERHLSSPLTRGVALRLATQVRALETMFPAVSEVLTDVSAADVGGTLVGLGLFVRQFEPWREFIDEAQKMSSLDVAVMDALKEARGKIQEQPNDVVELDLKKELTELSELVSQSEDPVVQTGYARSIGNVYRAVGRFIRNRASGASKNFGDSLDKKVGEGLADITFSGLVVGATIPLTQLAAAAPDDFGWVIPLLAVLAARKHSS